MGCPFCGHVPPLATVTAPTRLSVALLGLCLAACTGTAEAPKPNEVEPQPAGTSATPQADDVVKPTTAIEPEPTPPELPAADETGETGETGETTSDQVPEVEGSQGTTDGSSTKPAIKQPKPDPRPAKTYGGPPKPGLEPLD